MSDNTTWFSRFKRKMSELSGLASQKITNNETFLPAEILYDGKALLGSIKTGSANKVKDFVEEFNKALPITEEAGYKLQTVEIRLGIPPKLIPHFKQERELSTEEKEELMLRIKDRPYTKMLLSTLFKSSEIQNSLKIGNLPAGVIQIELTAVPNIILVYGEF